MDGSPSTSSHSRRSTRDRRARRWTKGVLFNRNYQESYRNADCLNGERGIAQLVSSVNHHHAPSTLTFTPRPPVPEPVTSPKIASSAPPDAAVRCPKWSGGVRGGAGRVELQWWENFMAGASASLISKTILQPFDTTRTILQASKKVRGSYNNLWECATGIVRTKGFPALYTGLMVSIAVSAPSSAIFLTAYEQAKRAAEDAINALTGFRPLKLRERGSTNRVPGESLPGLSVGSGEWHVDGWWNEERRARARSVLLPAAPALAAVAGNVMSSLVRVPPEVVKQRVQAGQFAGLLAAVTSMWRAEGLSGFYTGYSTMVARDIPYAAIQFTTFETLKRRREKILAARALASSEASKGGSTGLPCSAGSTGQGSKSVAARQLSQGELLLSNMWIGAMAGAMATIFTSPLDVLKTRVMTQEVLPGQAYLGTREMLAKVWAEEGIVAFGRGMTPRLLYKVPSSAVFLVSYEAMRRILVTARRQHDTLRWNNN
ncbi:unnamed protein product [Closterium sp. Yama58-4]|nr:unnamed protein product [Closterium sp. Yama58-4]